MEQADVILDTLYKTIALRKSALEKEGLEAELAERPLLPAVFRRLRDRDKTIASLRKANERLGKKIKVLRALNARLEARIAKLRTTRAVLSKALYGSKSEKQDKARSERKRGQQRGAPGHSRTQRPTLEEKEERHNPPQDARVCFCCGKPYVANGELSSGRHRDRGQGPHPQNRPSPLPPGLRLCVLAPGGGGATGATAVGHTSADRLSTVPPAMCGSPAGARDGSSGSRRSTS